MLSLPSLGIVETIALFSQTTADLVTRGQSSIVVRVL